MVTSPVPVLGTDGKMIDLTGREWKQCSVTGSVNNDNNNNSGVLDCPFSNNRVILNLEMSLRHIHFILKLKATDIETQY